MNARTTIAPLASDALSALRLAFAAPALEVVDLRAEIDISAVARLQDRLDGPQPPVLALYDPEGAIEPFAVTREGRSYTVALLAPEPSVRVFSDLAGALRHGLAPSAGGR